MLADVSGSQSPAALEAGVFFGNINDLLHSKGGLICVLKGLCV